MADPKFYENEKKLDEILSFEEKQAMEEVAKEVVNNITNLSTVNNLITSASTSPGGSDTQVQFNNGGVFGGDAEFVYNKTTNILTVDGTIQGGASAGLLTVQAGSASGEVDVLGGDAGATSVAGGDVVMLPGDGGTLSGSPAGGDFYAEGGAGGSPNGVGGRIQLFGGAGTGTGNGGLTEVQGGSGGTGGSLDLHGGNSGGNAGYAAVRMGGGGINTAANDNVTTRYFDTRATTDATAVALITHSPASSTINFYRAYVRAVRTGGAAGSAQDCAGYVIYATYKRVGAAAPALVGTIAADYTAEDQAGWDATFAVSGNNVIVQITGAVNNNITWIGELIIM